MTGTERLADSIKAELEQLLPRQRKTQRGKLSLLVATMLAARSANLMDLAAALPLEADRTDMRYQWIARFLANPLVDTDAVMAPFARQVLERLAGGEPLALILDQSKISDRHQVLMLAVRFGERALPLAWRVETTEGAIGFETQKALLEAVAPWLPEGPAHGRPLLRHRQPDRLVPGAGLPVAPEGQPDGVRWSRNDGGLRREADVLFGGR